QIAVDPNIVIGWPKVMLLDYRYTTYHHKKRGPKSPKSRVCLLRCNTCEFYTIGWLCYKQVLLTENTECKSGCSWVLDENLSIVCARNIERNIARSNTNCTVWRKQECLTFLDI